MAERMFVKPSKPGLVCRDPRTRRKLPEEGGYVPDNTHWRRRLIAGDVVETPPPKSAKPAKPKDTRKAKED